VITFVKSHPADFGGIYFDSDGVLTISLARGGTEDRDAATKLIPSATVVRWLRVEHSISDLDLVRDMLVDRIPQFERDGGPVSSISIDAARNLVVLTLDGDISGANEALRGEFGTQIDVRTGGPAVPDLCTNRYACTPWRGGIAIDSASGGSGICSYGYNSRQYDGTALRMLTAGHCNSHTWYHGTGTIGTTSLNNLGTSNKALGDFQRVPTSFTGTKNLIYANDATMSRSILFTRNNSLQLQGDSVCKSGIGSGSGGGYKCGTILNDDLVLSGVVYNGTVVYVWGKLASYASGSGDSGGPVFINNIALGIHSGYLSGQGTVYSTVEYAEFALSVSICLSTSCS
jgi:hypothetical protein